MAKKELAAYRAKRNFKRTSEPSGKAATARAKYPRFVIQKHAASRLHYDLRLEHAGVLRQTTVGRRNRAWECVGLFDLLDRFERELGPAARTPRPTR